MTMSLRSLRSRVTTGRNMPAAVACVVIGVTPMVLYSQLPFRVDYIPYTVRHVTATLGLLGFTALGFFQSSILRSDTKVVTRPSSDIAAKRT